MAGSTKTENEYFTLLVLQYQMSAMIALGKLVHPLTQKVERHLDEARHYIELLAMLEEKTTGNLVPEEEQLLKKVLTELRLNYVDESRKPEASEKPKAPSDSPKPESASPEPSSPEAAEAEGPGPEAPARTDPPKGRVKRPEAPGSEANPVEPVDGEGPPKVKAPSKKGAPPQVEERKDPATDIGGEGGA